MKKIILIILATMMLIALTGCGRYDRPRNENNLLYAGELEGNMFFLMQYETDMTESTQYLLHIKNSNQINTIIITNVDFVVKDYSNSFYSAEIAQKIFDKYIKICEKFIE